MYSCDMKQTIVAPIHNIHPIPDVTSYMMECRRLLLNSLSHKSATLLRFAFLRLCDDGRVSRFSEMTSNFCFLAYTSARFGLGFTTVLDACGFVMHIRVVVGVLLGYQSP